MRKLTCILVLGCAACSPEPQTNVAFTAHAQVSCKEVSELKAALGASGIDGVCPLTVNQDRTVTGTCFNVPAGEMRTFRLVYFTTLDRDYELAVATEVRDLTDLRRDSIILEFAADSLDIERDDDGDGFRNLEEFCCGSHPGIILDTCQ